ncbi:cobyric acid synthase [Ruminococcus sp. CLA-AA-H200]|uniref:Cobyric acid synthase n=1 Tax=Ruminococcus turbiniformis TaxID=2881258 RepID=A0ABS8G4S2_9FIRM|nr:cobyric acid synthase [Ruminococcus turbiniformis]MCC2255899.1 cobyric acid synthase [Ruminococcus turbiniformis]
MGKTKTRQTSRPIMIQGTMSNVGKSALAAGLCRVLAQDGFSVAPFKSQNMALNSFITKEGLEMGRAQVMQAEAAGIDPEAAMNPILLKPTNDTGSQVIINGIPVGVMSAVEYYRHKKEYIPYIIGAYESLSRRFDVIVIEGAGSPAEINLKKDDIVNMGMAELVDAPVLLAGDIDRGGVFAQIAGTVMLLEEQERRRIKGTIINKFRGDVSILKPGLTMLEDLTKIPVLGVVPYFNLDLDDEDSLTERFENRKKKKAALVDIAVIRLPRISNFTDFAPLEAMEEVNVRYIDSPSEFGNPDAVILPGTKNTIQDLLWLRQSGLEAQILKYGAKGGVIFGICGGYQMLGLAVRDPKGAEQKGSIRGMGLLPAETVFEEEKRRTRVHGRFCRMSGVLSGLSGARYEGYEIHMGRTTAGTGEHAPKALSESAANAEGACGGPLVTLARDAEACSAAIPGEGYGMENGMRNGTECETRETDGVQSGSVYGCYIHGIFDSPEVSGGFVKALLRKKGYDPERVKAVNWKTYKEEQYDRLADILRESLDMEAIYQIIEKGNDAPCVLS